MISKFFKLISIYSLTLCFQTICIPNSLAQVDFDEKNIASYFSGSVSLNNNDNSQAVKYFNSTLVAEFIINKTLGINNKKRFLWNN